MARSSAWPGWLLAFAVLMLLAGLGWLLWPTATADHMSARATVLEPSDCGAGGTSRDVVRFELGGRSVRAELDGCGHRAGAQIVIEVPDTSVHDGMTVRLAGTGVSAGALTTQRLASVLLALAGAAGALLAWRVRSRWPG